MLITNALTIMTGLVGEAARAAGSDIRIADGRIVAIAAIGALRPTPGERVLDASGCVVYPGWVNTHHHLTQCLQKGVPGGLNLPLMGWLQAVPYKFRRHFDADLMRTAAEIGITELIMAGCTTIAEHHYVYWPGIGFDAAEIFFDAAERLGVRFVLARGGATVDRFATTDNPDAVQPEAFDDIVADVQRIRDRWHQTAPDAMRRVALAPSTPTWSCLVEELKPFARVARSMGIRLHSHLSETVDYVRFCREKFNCSPFEFVAEHEWVGSDVWFAHMVHLSEAEVRMVAQTGTGTAHCPASNCRLGSGIAPAPALHRAGATVSMGVDGPASNEAADMISEVHTAWHLHRALGGAAATTVEDVIHWGTRGGAKVLGLDAVGTLEVGQAADIAVYSLEDYRYAGLHDPAIGPVVSGGRPRLEWLMVGGRLVVEQDAIPGFDRTELLARARRAVARLRG